MNVKCCNHSSVLARIQPMHKHFLARLNAIPSYFSSSVYRTEIDLQPISGNYTYNSSESVDIRFLSVFT